MPGLGSGGCCWRETTYSRAERRGGGMRQDGLTGEALDAGLVGGWTAPSAARALRILTCLHSFEPGGVERVAFRLNARWAELGLPARVIVGRDTGSAREAARGAPVELIPGGGGARSQLWWMIRKLPAMLRRERPDVLFCAGNTYTSVGVAMKLLLGGACPPVVAKVSNDLVRRDMGPMLRFAYRRWCRIQGQLLDRFVAMAPAMVDEIAEAMGVARDRIDVVHDPVLRGEELAEFEALPRPAPLPSGRRYLAIGRLMPQKNFALLLQAFAAMAGPQDRLTILGEGPERAALEAQAAALGISDRVAMPGHVSDLKPWLAANDVFVMSSLFEGVPAVVIEALAAGLAMVATDCSVSMRDLLGGGAFGALVPVGDAQALAAAMAAPPAPAP
ncbi:MAG: glycosyltransferase, partial [Sphingomonas sp.]|nr:glycosyltransferase [Sphingomonas sp.]